MAVVSCMLKSRSRVDDSIGGRSYTDVWQVLTDIETDGADVVLSAMELPDKGDTRNGGASVCTRRSAEQDDNDRLNWTVTVSWEPRTSEHEGGGGTTPPTSRPVRRSFSTVAVDKAATKDRDGNPILNTAGVEFDPPPHYRVYNAVATFVRYESTFSSAFALQLAGAVNAAAWGGFEPGQVQCTEVSATEVFEDGVRYWEVTYSFEATREGWQLSLLSNGSTKVVDCEHVAIEDSNGVLLTEPVPLDENGDVISPCDLPGAAYYVTANVYQEYDFNLLGLPV